MKKLISVLVVMVLLLAACGQPGADQDNNQPETAPETEDTRTYTLEQYLHIEMGSSYDEVAAILGSGGEATVDNERLKQYMWQNEDDSNISVNFYDNIVTGKSQAYLGPYLEGKDAVTLNEFDQVSEGMSLDEVSNILGPGTERMRAITDGEEKIILGWDNSDGSGIGITFMDGKVMEKSSLMLD